MAAFYPKIGDEQWMQFKVVVDNMLKDPNYLKSDDCPYNMTFIEYLMKLRPPEVQDIFAGQEETLVIEEQIQMILNDLESMSASILKADTTERLNYFKTKTMLFGKLIDMREKNNTIKDMNEFRNIILQFMDDVCTKDQITELMHRLDEVQK